MANHAKREIFTSGTLFGDGDDPTSGTDPLFSHIPFSRATAVDLESVQIGNYLVARDVGGHIDPKTKFYIRVNVPYKTVNDNRSYPKVDTVLNYMMMQVTDALIAAGPHAVGIEGIIIDELLVPVPWNYGIENRAADLVSLFQDRLNQEGGSYCLFQN